ncbi:MAG: helix-turn-helix domain-containing protein [Nannocystaceae bacterium]
MSCRRSCSPSCPCKFTRPVIGEIVLTLRKRVGLKQNEFARRISRSERWVRRLEGGQVDITISELFSISGVLGVHADALVSACSQAFSDSGIALLG